MQEAANAAELKRIIENLPLETSAVAPVEFLLGKLEPSQFAALLTELARDNHAFRCGADSVSIPSGRWSCRTPSTLLRSFSKGLLG